MASKIELLLVEDERIWQSQLERHLKRYNLNVTSVENAENARTRISDRIYDVVVLDVGEASFGGNSWSKVDGNLADWIGREHPQAYDFADWIKENHPNIFLVGYSSLAEDAEQSHFDAVLGKWSLTELLIDCLSKKGFKIRGETK